jgi:H(+)-translocating pyrophosphatase
MKLSFAFSYTFIFLSCVLGLIFGFYNWYKISSIDTEVIPEHLKDDEAFKKSSWTMNETSRYIQEGARTFLFSEYIYLGIFTIVFAIILMFIDNFKFYTVISFILGSITSLLSGYIGMYVATKTNVRVTYEAATNRLNEEKALSSAFNCAFRGGCVMGFVLVSLGLLVLTFVIIIIKAILSPETTEEYTQMFEFISGYGLGGSCVALFCRVGGGIYTKAADVGADLVGKNELGLNEDSPENPATIADNVGDNVGDIAGMGSDLFGSFAESSCAALVVSGTSQVLTSGNYYMFPLLITAGGILCSFITSFFATHIIKVTSKDKIQNTLKWQLFISTILLTPVIVLLALFALPENFSFVSGVGSTQKIYNSTNVGVMVCALVGLYSGLAIGLLTDYFTSNEHGPVQDLAIACKSGEAINIIQGLALGYLSCLVPIICLAITICVSFVLANMYGIAIAALGMLSNLAISLAIDGYGPISDNAGGIAEMSELPEEVRGLTDALDAAGNTTAAIGKGFAIGSACLVGLALFGAFVTRSQLGVVDLLAPLQLACIVFGAMIPYAFCAMTMKSVGVAAAQMCESIKIQIMNKKSPDEKPDYKQCIKISTDASLKEMILPGVMVIFTPIVLGILFGPKAIAGYLVGIIVSGVMLAISQSNSGGAWDNAKKYIEAKKLRIEADDINPKKNENNDMDTSSFYDVSGKEFYGKKSKPHKAAVVGDTVGDPLKDTSGPSLNILIKLSSIISLVFAGFFMNNYLISA